MDKLKERDYMFDAFRGLLILCIPLSHFTRMSGILYAHTWLGTAFDKTSLAGFIYITINVFVMQAFMFLSGYFSKNVDKARAGAFRGLLWPYFVAMVLYYFLGKCLFHFHGGLDFLYPKFALWFLLALFFYRFFLKDIIQFRWALPTAIIFYLIVGQIHNFSNFLEVQRLFSYLPFFLIGYYCSKERLDQIRRLKERPVLLALLGLILVGSSILLMNVGPGNVEWYLMRKPEAAFLVPWYADILLRFSLLFIGAGWMIFFMNVLPNKKTFLCFVGTHTMPIYIFHLVMRYVFRFYGVYVGAIGCLSVAAVGLISLAYVRADHNKRLPLLILGLLVTAGIIAMFATGCLAPIYGGCPQNPFLFYTIVIGSALTIGLGLTCPCWTKAYDILMEGPLHASRLATWLQKDPTTKKDDPRK